jgi:PKD repeat protein
LDSTAWTANVSYGDGSGIQPLTLNVDKTFTLSHPYTDSGIYTITVTVKDNTGGIGTDTAIVTVTAGWSGFSGFYYPIEMGIMNSFKAGNSIPVKWHLADADGNDISDPASFGNLVSYGVNCPNSRLMPASSDIVRIYPGSSGLQYLGGGNWRINWKTLKNYAGTCRNMYIEFNSGQKSPEVLFNFK